MVTHTYSNEEVMDMLDSSVHRLHSDVFRESRLIGTAGVYTVLYELVLHARDTLHYQGLKVKDVRDLEKTARIRYDLHSYMMRKNTKDWR